MTVKRRTVLGLTGVGVSVPVIGFVGLDGGLGDAGDETGNEPSNESDSPDTTSLAASGSLKIENTDTDPWPANVTIERSDDGGKQPLFEASTKLEPGDTIIVDELVSTPGRYHLEAEIGDERDVHEWDVDEGGTPANVTARIQEAGTLDVTVLRTH